ncbi:MAG: hypothetical protein Q9183_006683 [Haloplaca sp. 2 TL-2023]
MSVSNEDLFRTIARDVYSIIRESKQQDQAKLAQQARQEKEEQIRQEQVKQQELVKQEQLKHKAKDTRLRALAQINQIQAAFCVQHAHTCRRCPERFSSNSKLHKHIAARHTRKSAEKSPASTLQPTTPACASSTRTSAAAAATPQTPATPPSLPRIYMPPYRRTHITITQLFHKFGAT